MDAPHQRDGCRGGYLPAYLSIYQTNGRERAEIYTSATSLSTYLGGPPYLGRRYWTYALKRGGDIVVPG